MSRELLKRVLMARTIGYPLPPSIVKEIEAELAKDMPEPVARLAWFRKYERDIAELVISDASQGDSFPVYTHPPAQQKPLSGQAIIECIPSRFKPVVMGNEDEIFEFARAIEQAHGITS